MAQPKVDKKGLLHYGIVFLVVYLVLSVFVFPRTGQETVSGANFDVVTTSKEYGQSNLVVVTVKNNTELEAVIANNCPSQPFNVEKRESGQWNSVSATAELDCSEAENYIIPAQSELNIDFKNWNYELFNDLTSYRLSADIQVAEDTEKSGTYDSNEFEVKPQGLVSWLWNRGFYQPILNALIFLTSVLPGHDLGLAIILLTILLRTILLIPSQRAMKSQRRMQDLQPKLKKIQEKYKGNQEKIAQETMMLWKQNKVNPAGSCLPMFIQLPVLIGIFYVIQTGLTPNASYLLYGSLQEFSFLSINSNFLGILELTKVNSFILPLLVGGLQFSQMKLAMMRKKDKQTETNEKSSKQNEMQLANNMMIYLMPVMIAVFTASVPAGVGLYWCTSTLYGIAQQFAVNREVAGEDSSSSSVRVIKK